MNPNDLPRTRPMPLQIDADSLLPPSLASATVMMVDDEPLMTDLIRLHLEERGYRSFIVVNDPRQAMGVLRTRLPDVLLLDLNMPEMNGFEVLAALRSDQPNVRDTPVIVLTATTQADAKLRALALGATDFLAKPVDPSELVLRVRNTLAVRALIDRTVNHDTATGLPNRRALERSLRRQLTRDGDAGGIGLLNVTIAECRHIRETMGSAAADRLLRALAGRLTRTVRGGEASALIVPELSGQPVMRLDSDSFALLLRLQDADAAAHIAKRVLAAMLPSVSVNGTEFALTTHIGIALAPADGHDPDTLIKAADHARTQAQSGGGPGYEFFSAELNARHHQQLRLGAHLRRAAERDELLLHYQPKLDVASGAITGAEALLRWDHPEHGLIPPGRFIPLAEELGLIVGIGDWVIRRACADAARWPHAGGKALRVAVNVSQLQFESGTLVQVLRDALGESGLAPARLIVELTESMLIRDTQRALDQMRAIKALGVSLSIDDFGTGYSSLGHLKRLPVDELKVDRSFVMDLPGGAQDRAIVATVIALGHSLGMTVVAEGVEVQAQLDTLRALGCDAYQGFLFSKPVPEAAFLARVCPVA